MLTRLEGWNIFFVFFFFFFLIEMRFRHVGQAGLELLTSGDPSSLASQSAGITCVSHWAQPTDNRVLIFFRLLGGVSQVKWASLS